jgi:YD repeat-containing protein
MWSRERPDRYDAAGRILGISLLEGDSVVEVGEFQFDAAGRILLSKLTLSQGSTYTSRYEYDAQGRMTVLRFFLGDSLTTVDRYLYDGNGRQVSDARFNGKGDTLSVASMEYDGAGRRIREVDRVKGDSLGYLGSETRNEYDAAGHLVTVKSYGGNGVLKSTESYVYARVEIPLALAGRVRLGPGRTGMGPVSAISAAGRDALGRRLPFPMTGRAHTAGFPSLSR